MASSSEVLGIVRVAMQNARDWPTPGRSFGVEENPELFISATKQPSGSIELIVGLVGTHSETTRAVRDEIRNNGGLIQEYGPMGVDSWIIRSYFSQ